MSKISTTEKAICWSPQNFSGLLLENHIANCPQTLTAQFYGPDNLLHAALPIPEMEGVMDWPMCHGMPHVLTQYLH